MRDDRLSFPPHYFSMSRGFTRFPSCSYSFLDGQHQHIYGGSDQRKEEHFTTGAKYRDS